MASELQGIGRQFVRMAYEIDNLVAQIQELQQALATSNKKLKEFQKTDEKCPSSEDSQV